MLIILLKRKPTLNIGWEETGVLHIQPPSLPQETGVTEHPITLRLKPHRASRVNTNHYLGSLRIQVRIQVYLSPASAIYEVGSAHKYLGTQHTSIPR